MDQQGADTLQSDALSCHAVALCCCVVPLGLYWAAFASPQLLPEWLGQCNSSLHTKPMGQCHSTMGQHDAGCCVAGSVFPASKENSGGPGERTHAHQIRGKSESDHTKPQFEQNTIVSRLRGYACSPKSAVGRGTGRGSDCRVLYPAERTV